MKRPRPYIPLSVRVQVAERQFIDKFCMSSLLFSSYDAQFNLARRLEWLLKRLFQKVSGDGSRVTGVHPHALDHDPALILRKFNPRNMKYTPDANDPEFLIYREASDHQQKTTGRKPGALRTVTTKGSDIGLKTKFARLERAKTKKKVPIRSRGFAKGRKQPWPKRSMS